MALLKIRTLQTIEGATVYSCIDEKRQTQLIAIPDMSWSALINMKESTEDVEEDLVMELFNLMDEVEAESLAHELTLILFDKGDER